MKKITAISSITTVALILSLTAITTNQSKRSIKKNGFKISKMRFGLSKAFAADNNQRIYKSAQREVNDEVSEIIDNVEALLTAAKITSCKDIPAPNEDTTDRLISESSKGDLYSSKVGTRDFPISSVTNVKYDKKVKLKMGSDEIGVLYVDCTSHAIEVRYLGKHLKVKGDTNIVIAYHEDKDELQSLLMFSDYDAGEEDGISYSAAKLAIRYIETASNQTLNYSLYEGGAGNSGTLIANTSGIVTGNTPGVILITEESSEDLNDLVISGVDQFDHEKVKNGVVTLL